MYGTDFWLFKYCVDTWVQAFKVWISVWTLQLELCILSLKPFLHILVWAIHKRTFVMFLLSCFQKSIRYWNFRIAWGCLTCVIFFAFWSPWLFSHALLPDFGDGLINLHLSSLKHFFWRFSRWKENLLCVSRLMIQIGSSTGTEGSSE